MAGRVDRKEGAMGRGFLAIWRGWRGRRGGWTGRREAMARRDGVGLFTRSTPGTPASVNIYVLSNHTLSYLSRYFGQWMCTW